MDPTTMSTAVMIVCALFGLLVITFLVVGIAAGIKYLRAPQEPVANDRGSLTDRRPA
jgi:hypothetical protein